MVPAEKPINLDDYALAAKEKLSDMAWGYYSSGAHDQLTLKENQEAYRRLKLKYKVLVDVSKRSMNTQILGQDLSMPILVSPTAFQGMACPEGELAMARAAGKAGTIMTLSTLSNYSIEEVAEAACGPLWFQLYVYKDRGITKWLVERAEKSGYKALVITVDAPLIGQREADLRNGFHLPPGLRAKNLSLPGMDKMNLDSPQVQSALFEFMKNMSDQSLSWKDIEWFRSITKLPILLKGIVRADDALNAVSAGASGIIVSNHGGRQLDTAIATIDALPAIAAAVGNKTDILIDGGIRRGTDILKALALGAKGVLLGRATLWGLCCNGEAGASHVLKLMRDDLDLAMALSGCPTLADITPDLIA